MRALLDTHTFLWWITDDQRVSSRVRRILRNGSNEVFLSSVSGWEIIIKAQLGRLKLADDPARFIQEQIRLNSFQSLPVEMKHALHLFSLPTHHKDPFDRMLIAQAQLEGLPILTADTQIGLYSVEVIW